MNTIVAKKPRTINAQEHQEYMAGWSLYQDSGQPVGACTNDSQRRGWLEAQTWAQRR